MEPKKSPKANLENKRSLFFQIGLATALMLTIGVFASSQSEKTTAEIYVTTAPVPDTDLVEVTREKTPVETAAVQPVVLNPERINIRPNTATINTNIVWDPEAVPDPLPLPPVEKPIDGGDPVYTVEFMPEFLGGDLARFRSWVMGQLIYPPAALENRIQGKVTLTFVIERDGTLSNIEVLSSPDRSLTEEAIRVLSLSPQWTPGRQGTTAVRVRFNLPLEFRLK